MFQNIVEAFGYRGDFRYAEIIMEKLDGTVRDLAMCAELDEAQIARIMWCCIKALAYMHEYV